jgi:hypothetical protein
MGMEEVSSKYNLKDLADDHNSPVVASDITQITKETRDRSRGQDGFVTKHEVHN